MPPAKPTTLDKSQGGTKMPKSPSKRERRKAKKAEKAETNAQKKRQASEEPEQPPHNKKPKTSQNSAETPNLPVRPKPTTTKTQSTESSSTNPDPKKRGRGDRTSAIKGGDLGSRSASVSSNASGKQGAKEKKSGGKKEATIVRISNEQKKLIADGDRAIYVALDKKEHNNGNVAAKFKALRGHIATYAKVGQEKCIASGTSYWAVIYTTTAMRDSAIHALQANPTVPVENDKGIQQAKVQVSKFGTTDAPTTTVWTIGGAALSSRVEVASAIKLHFVNVYPIGFECGFYVCERLEWNVHDGFFIAVFDTALPKSKFRKQIAFLKSTFLITEEPLKHCRFCQKSGHSLIACTSGPSKTISTDKEEDKAKGGQEEEGEDGTMEPEESADMDIDG